MQKYTKKWVFESAAGEPKNEVFWAKSRVEPPRGVGGSPSDLMLISKITGFLDVISPMGQKVEKRDENEKSLKFYEIIEKDFKEKFIIFLITEIRICCNKIIYKGL